MTFQKAFAAARKAGKKEFTWNGKRYNTELKETVKPKARPKAASTSKSSEVKAPPRIQPNDPRDKQKPGPSLKMNGLYLKEKTPPKRGKYFDEKPMSRTTAKRIAVNRELRRKAGQREF